MQCTLLSDKVLKSSIEKLSELGYSRYDILIERLRRGFLSRNKYSEAEITFMYNNYAIKGKQYCVDYLKLSHSRFKCLSKALGLKRVSKYNIDIVQSPNKYLAYTLGLLTADGYITKCKTDEAPKHHISISQNVNDIIPILPILYKELKWRLAARINHGYSTNILISLSFGDRNKTFYNILDKYGFLNKTYVFPEIHKYIPEENIKYFIRGFLDGDGHVSCNLIKQYQSSAIGRSTAVGFTGNKNCDWSSFFNILSKHNICYTYKVYDNCSRIYITRHSDLLRFYNAFYTDDDGIYLPRKFKKLQQIKQYIER